MNLRVLFVAALTLIAVLFLARRAEAHKPSDSYLTLDLAGHEVRGRWDLAVRDLDYAMGIDGDGNGEVTWGEVRAKEKDVADYVFSHLELRSGGAACPITPGALHVVRHSDGTYAVLNFAANCATDIRVLDASYALFFDVDKQHRGLVRVHAHGATRTAAFSAGERALSFDTADMSALRPFFAMVKEGISHIGQGYDHLLFLIALLLTSVLVRKGDAWEPVPSFRPALLDTAKIVTAFTLAHSITLALSATRTVNLPSRFVEASIAISVIVAALNNVRRFLGKDRWVAAFALGLLHGFAFSSTLLDLGLPREDLLVALFGFNVGVELGQFAVVAAFLPLAFLARKTTAYRKGALVGGSIVIALIASVWFVERAFVVTIFARL